MLEKICTFWRRQIKAHSFRRFWGIAAIALTILWLSGLYLIFVQQRSWLRERSSREAQQAAINLTQFVSSVEGSAVSAGNLWSVWRTLGNPSADLDTLRAMTQDISSFTDYNSYQSVEIFFERSQRVYVSDTGMYDYEDYFDPDFLDQLHENKNSSHWILNRNYKHYYGAQYPMTVASYVQRLPLFNATCQGFLSIQIKMSTLLTAVAPNGLENMSVTWMDTQLADNRPAHVFDTCSFESTDTSISVYIPWSAFWQRTGWRYGLLTGGYLIALLIAAGLAVIYTRSAQRPALSLLGKMGVLEYDQADPYGGLGDAIDSLSLQLSELTKANRRSRTLAQEQLLTELIYRDINLTDRLEECTRCGLHFPHDLFAVVLLDIRPMGGTLSYLEREQLRLLIRQNCRDILGTLGPVWEVSGEFLIFLLNSPGSVEDVDENGPFAQHIRQACNQLSSILGTVLSFMRFSVGICNQQTPNLYRAYLTARRGLSYASDDSEAFISYTGQELDIPYADGRLLDDLAQSIFNREPEQLDKLLERHRSWYLREDVPIRQMRKTAEICLCLVFGRLLESDYSAGEKEFAAAARRLSQASQPMECHEILREYFFSLIHSHEKVSDRSYAYVRRAIAYIEENYSRNFAIPEIAEALSINPVYLNKIFKLSRGKTVSEYLNHYRITLSIDMMGDTKKTLAEISSAVGYPDVRNYIRYFKKFYGVTPSEYRKQLAETGTVQS